MKPFLNNVSGKSKSDIIYLNGGLNACNDQTEVQDNQLTYMYNVSLRNSPTLETRQDRLSIAWKMDDLSNYGTNEIRAMFCSSSQKLYTVEDYDNTTSKVYMYEDDGLNITKTYIGDVAKANNYSICECRDSNDIYIYFSSFIMSYKYTEGDSFTTGGSTGIIASHKNRLWATGGSWSDYTNVVKFSNLQDFDNFTIDPLDPVNTAGEIQLTNARGNIVALVPFDGKLIVLCERSWHIIYGSTPNISLSDSFYVVDMVDGVGCCSSKGFAVCDRNLYWMDSDCSVYRYNGASLVKVSEPYGNDNYAQYGGIKNFVINKEKLKNVCMSSYDNYLYICCTHSIDVGSWNDTFLVYDTRNRVWWVEDGAFSYITNWEKDDKDYFVGARFNGDILWLNTSDKGGYDTIYNFVTNELEEVNINYSFETKTWLLNSVKNKKTLTNLWWQADANAEVSVHDNWTDHHPGEEDIDLLPIGNLKKARAHSILTPNRFFHEGNERQRTIIPKMYLQKVNSFAIVVAGTGYGNFHLLEKEWRIR